MPVRTPFWRRQWVAALGIALVLVVVLVAAARANPTSAGVVGATATVPSTVERSRIAAPSPTEGESPTAGTTTATQQPTPSTSGPASTSLPGGLTPLVIAPEDTAH